jgi:hypothetical protein
MPNPYHDADGKFASRDGLNNKIDLAFKEGRMDDYLRERKNLDDIERKITAGKKRKSAPKTSKRIPVVSVGTGNSTSVPVKPKLDAQGYLDESEIANIKIYGISCPECGAEIGSKAHSAGEDDSAVCENGHETFIDELKVKMTPDNPSAKFLDKQAVKDSVWYHSTLDEDWLNSVQKDEDAIVHLGVEDASYDRALWDYARKAYGANARSFYMYEVRISNDASVSDRISQSNYTVDREREEELDEDIKQNDVTRYFNTAEAPGSISLTANPQKLEVISVRKIEAAEAQQRLSVQNINPKYRNKPVYTD